MQGNGTCHRLRVVDRLGRPEHDAAGRALFLLQRDGVAVKRSGFKRKEKVDDAGRPVFSTFSARPKPMAQRSKKQQRAYDGDADAGLEGRRDFVERILLARPHCEAFIPRRSHRCGFYSSEVHEVLRRSAGGDIVDDDNVKAVCNACHRWIHLHPKASKELGLLVSRHRPRTP